MCSRAICETQNVTTLPVQRCAVSHAFKVGFYVSVLSQALLILLVDDLETREFPWGIRYPGEDSTTPRPTLCLGADDF